MSFTKKSKDVAELLITRSQEPEDIDVKLFRRLFLLGLGCLLREADAISYNLRNKKGGF
jgi:hypothetical protein